LNAPTIHREDKKNEPSIPNAEKITREPEAQSLSSTEKSSQFKERYKRGSKNKKYLIMGSVAIVLGFAIWGVFEINKRKSLPDFDKREEQVWNTALEKNDSLNYKSYLNEFPEGQHAMQAHRKIDSLIKISNSHNIHDTLNKYFVVVGSHEKMDDAIKQANELSRKNIPFDIHIYKSDNGIYAVCLGGYLTNEEAHHRRNYAKDNIKPDAYIRVSILWGNNLYEHK